MAFASQIVFNNNDNDITISRNESNIRIDVNRVNIDYLKNYSHIHINGAQYIMDSGYPFLPFIPQFIYAENMDDIHVTVGQREIFALKENQIIHSQTSVFKGDSPIETARNESVYNTDAFYPYNDYDIIDAGYSHGRHMFLIRIFPIRYNPVQNTFSVSDYYTIEHRDNYDVRSQVLPSQYLIVTPPHSSVYIDSFILSKKRQGYIVNIMFTDTAGATRDSIKTRIQNVYDNSPFPLTYVLLLGDTEYIPNFTGTELNAPPTDLYYTTMEGNDYFPDIYAGRISVNDSFELDTVLKKIIRMENSSWTSGDVWVNRAYLMASNDGSYHQLAEGTQNFAASKLRALPMTVDSLYYYYNTGTPVIDAVNSGRSIMLYTGHGTETSWSGPTLSQSSINALNNADMNPLIFSFACLTGDFAHGTECFGETWLKNSTGAGAFVGSSVTSLWYEDDIMERSLINAITDSTRRDLGYLLEMSKRGVYAAYGGAGYSKRYFEMYNILGDPSMNMNTDIEGDLHINGNTIISEEADSMRYYIANQYNPVPNASVSIVMDDSLICTGKTDSNGYIALANTFSNGDSLGIYAYAVNYRYGYMPVICSNDSYIDLKRIIINDELTFTGVKDSVFSAGDRGWMKLEVISYGSDTMKNVSALIRHMNDFVSSDDSIITIADYIIPGDTVISSDSIYFTVMDTAECGSEQYIYTALSSDSLAEEFNVILPVLAPRIEYGGFDIVNKTANEIEGGDSLTVIVNIKNSGDMADMRVLSHIITHDTLMHAENDTLIKNYIDADSSYADTVLFIISESVSDFTILPFTLSVNDTFGNTYMFRDSLFVNTLDYLVLDYDMNHNSGPSIDSILDHIGYNGHYKQSIKRNELYNYKHIFMCRGSYPNAVLLTPSDSIANLIDTLLNDGIINFYMEGGECWYFDVHVSGGYDFSETFGISGISDGGSISSLTGLDPYIANGMNFTYSGDNQYLDYIEPNAGTALFSDGSHTMGVSNKTAQYRTVGLSFELGGLEDNELPSTKSQLLKNIMDYFNRLTGIVGNNDCEDRIKITYSSVSSSQCNFFISGKQGDIVEIDIYDISGRTVMSDNITINSASGIKWEADMGQNNTSGIYFFRMRSSSGYVEGGKFIIIR